REVVEHFDGGIAEALVVLEITADKDQLRTKLARLPSRHAAADAECFRFIGGGKHHTAAERDRLAAQGRIEQLLDRRVKRIEIRMKDGGCRFPTDHPLPKKRCAENRPP